MPSDDFLSQRSWVRKFRDAFRGVFRGIAGQSSFAVHIFFAVAVVGMGAWFGVSKVEWSVLVLCITLVFVAELLNSSLELLAKAIDTRPNPLIGTALDISSGAVLVGAIGTSVVGLIVFLPHVTSWLWQLAGLQ